MIAEVLETMRDAFLDDWVGEIHIGDTQYTGSAESWINISVEPIYNELLSYAGCVSEEHALYVTCYHRNSVQAALLADTVIAFAQNSQFGQLYTRTWRPINQGMMDDGKAFYKLSIPIDIIN